MKRTRSAAGLLGLATLAWTTATALAQWTPELRRARPVDEPPVARALPLDELNAAPPRRSTEEAHEPRTRDTERSDQRQLDYANALFTRKLYDLAAPEYQKYLDDYPGSRGRANAYFSLGECYRNLNKPSNARTNFQKVLNDFGDSEFTGPAAYALGEMAFTQKDYGAALPLFHRSAAKSKEPAVALSAHYFEARCLEALGRKEEASDIYLEIADVGNPNPYREDTRWTLSRQTRARLTRHWLTGPQRYCKKAALCLKLENSARLRRSVCAGCNIRPDNTRSCWPITKKNRINFPRQLRQRCCC